MQSLLSFIRKEEVCREYICRFSPTQSSNQLWMQSPNIAGEGPPKRATSLWLRPLLVHLPSQSSPRTPQLQLWGGVPTQSQLESGRFFSFSSTCSSAGFPSCISEIPSIGSGPNSDNSSFPCPEIVGRQIVERLQSIKVVKNSQWFAWHVEN